MRERERERESETEREREKEREREREREVWSVYKRTGEDYSGPITRASGNYKHLSFFPSFFPPFSSYSEYLSFTVRHKNGK